MGKQHGRLNMKAAVLPEILGDQFILIEHHLFICPVLPIFMFNPYSSFSILHIVGICMFYDIHDITDYAILHL